MENPLLSSLPIFLTKIVHAYLLRGQVVALGDLLVQLADVAEVRYQPRGTAVGQLAVEDERRLQVPGRGSRLLVLRRRIIIARPATGTVTARASVVIVVIVDPMMIAILHAVRGFLRYRRPRRSPRLEQRHPRCSANKANRGGCNRDPREPGRSQFFFFYRDRWDR